MLTESSSGAVGVSLGRQQHLHESRGEAWALHRRLTQGLAMQQASGQQGQQAACHRPALERHAAPLADFPCPAEQWSGLKLQQKLCMHTQVMKGHCQELPQIACPPRPKEHACAHCDGRVTCLPAQGSLALIARGPDRQDGPPAMNVCTWLALSVLGTFN